MVASIKRPVLRYHGGKFLLAPWIISHFPRHRIYVELFGGGGSVLMRKDRCYSEVYNDKWDTVVNVFRILRDPAAAAELERALRLTPYSRTEFDECGEVHLSVITCPIEKARRTILRSFAGFGSASTNNKHSTGFRADAKRSGSTPAQDWLTYPEQIKKFVNRLQGVVIENRDYAEVIDRQDSAETLFYADPPYLHETRNMKRGNAAYACELTDTDHEMLAEKLNAVQGMVVLSGYDSPLYDRLYSGWIKHKKQVMADGANPRTEVLWLSKNCAKTLQLF